MAGENAIFGEKIERGQQAGAFIAVDVRLVFGDMKCIRRSDLKEVGLRVQECVHRLSQCRFQRGFITDAVSSAKLS